MFEITVILAGCDRKDISVHVRVQVSDVRGFFFFFPPARVWLFDIQEGGRSDVKG